MKVCVVVLGLVLGLVLTMCVARSPYQSVLQHSRIRGRQQGPNVCAMQQIKGTEKKYFTNCKQWYHRKVCGKPTVITYECCPGYERIPGEKGCPAALPLGARPTPHTLPASDTHTHTARHTAHNFLTPPPSLSLSVFRPACPFLSLSLDRTPRSKEIELLELLHYHMDFDVHVHHYSNGIVTVNCARLIKPDQHATNGIVHVVDRVITAISNNVNTFIDVDEDLETLRTAIAAAGLTTMLESEGQFTIFAPTNEAFEKMPQQTLNRILGDPVALRDLLNYHILKQMRCAESIVSGTPMETLQGTVLEVGCDGDHMTLNGKAIVTKTDQLGTNGVVHYINELLVPDSAKTLLELAEGSSVSTATRLFVQAGLSPQLGGSEALTLLVPLNEAFKGDVSMSPDMKKLMTNHVLKERLSSKSLYDGQKLDTLGGISLRVFVYRNNLCIENVCIAAHDKTGRFATMFTVDKVLAPPTGTIMDVLKADDRFSLLVGAIQTAGMTELLHQQGALTFFAPTNDAFNALPRPELNQLLRDQQQLLAVLMSHVGEGVLVSGGVSSHTRVKPLQGGKLELGVRNYTVYVNKIPVTDADLMATNGVVHAVDNIVKPLPPKVDREQADGPAPPIGSATSSKVESRSFRDDDLFSKVIRSHTSRTMSRGQ
ncbi:transforming growth factor-beta-induced protein ig-h3 [Solea senegalensis]|uniref:Transforming growth factor-beta-induced protein ig-h3 n=1 Tax=Solea senegalensis TaxID=28829 RepID=A0AAV6SPS5_SOLSE|nr:transforming growth factor-beta-induced protein ig-h3 [Solea senegalensis]